jgi:hypothetical protein
MISYCHMDADRLTLQTAFSTLGSLKMVIPRDKAKKSILTNLNLQVNFKREKHMATVLTLRKMVTNTRDTWKTI